MEPSLQDVKDLQQVTTFFSHVRAFLRSPMKWLISMLKTELLGAFWDSAKAEAAMGEQARQGTAKEAKKAKAAGSSPAEPQATLQPIMSAYETVPSGKSFWDNPANDIRSWAEDVIRLQHNNDGAALSNLVDRLSTPDLTTLLKEVETTRERNWVAQEKFAKEVQEADKRRGTVTEASRYVDDYGPGPMRPGELSARGRARLADIAKTL
jgi:hypothetical protein